MEFEKVSEKLNNIEVNTTAAREHVGEIERQIRLIKERARAMVADMPFKYIPKQIVIHLIYFVALWLNAFPNKNGISEKYSPRKIVTTRSRF